MHISDVTSDVLLVFGSKAAMGALVTKLSFCGNMHQNVADDDGPAFSNKWAESAPKEIFIDD